MAEPSAQAAGGLGLSSLGLWGQTGTQSPHLTSLSHPKDDLSGLHIPATCPPPHTGARAFYVGIEPRSHDAVWQLRSGKPWWGVLPLPSLDLGVAARLSLVQFPGVWLG